jgi:hypothetical protein
VDLRPNIESALDAFSVDAVVTPPGGAAVGTRAIWLPPQTVDHPVGSEMRRAEMRRVLALPLEGLPQVPRGTVVSAPEQEGAAAANWRIEEAERVDFDHYRAVVVPA